MSFNQKHVTLLAPTLEDALDELKRLMQEPEFGTLDAAAIIAKHVDGGCSLDVYVLKEKTAPHGPTD